MADNPAKTETEKRKLDIRIFVGACASAPWAPTAGSEARVTRESATNTHTDPTEPSHRTLSLPRGITPRRRPPDSSGSTRVANASLGALSLGGGGVLT